MSQNLTPKQSEFLFYTSPGGDIKIDVFFQDETVWLTQKRMSELFDVEINTINYHLKEIFKSKELDENSVIRKIRTTANDGKEYLTRFYNLDVIIAVGYRVNSKQATQFRVWATKKLRNYIIKGFVINEEKLKNWIEKLNAFLEFNEYEILDNPGKISHEVARKLAEKEYNKFRIKQDKDYISDFDKQAKKFLKHD